MAANSTIEESITILGLGSLLSGRSSRVTFSALGNFRLGRVKNYRRVFAHSPAIFVEKGITRGLEMSSLSAEPCEGGSFVCSVFEVADGGQGMDAFREREEEFELRMVPFETLEGSPAGMGMLCVSSTDEAYVRAWGAERFEMMYSSRGVHTIWSWSHDSGLLPCGPYLRHCVLAAQRLGPEAEASFLDETFLVDRQTTVRQYLAGAGSKVMATLPPPELAERYGG